MNIRNAAGAILATAVFAWATPLTLAQSIPTNLNVGDFTFQFADPTSGQPITTLSIPNVGGTARVAVYLLQQGGTPTNLFQQLGMEALGVRLNYAAPAGIVTVPNTFNANITARPPPVYNPNGVSSDYDFIVRYGSGTGTNTATSAAIFEGLIDATDPLPFPGAEDPLGNVHRMLIGTFTFQALTGGTELLTAVRPFTGVDNSTGPNPQIIRSRNDGTTGPVPGSGATGEISIDPLLSTSIPTLAITVGGGGGVLTWIGGASGNWSNSGNWTTGVPASSNNTQIAFGPTANAAMINDLPGALILNQLTFYAGAPAYTLNGNGLDFRTCDGGTAPQIVTNSANNVTIGAALTLTNNLTVSGVGSLALTGAISGPGGLANAGSGTLTLGNAANSFTGGVTFSGGAVAAANLAALGSGALTFDGGAFAYSGPTATTAAPINLTSNSGTITVTSATATLTTTAAITGSGGLTKNGPGSLVLSGINSYTGPTNVVAGTLAVAVGAALGTGALTVGPAAALAGNGTINGHAEIAGAISPGLGSIGALHFTAPMAWDAGGTYAFAYSAITGLNPGVNYSTIMSSSTLDLSAVTAAKPFTIAITSLTAQTVDSPVTYTLGSFTNGGSGNGITGFNAATFAFTGTFSGVPAVSLDSTHNQLLLTLTPGSFTSLTWTGAANGSWSNAANWNAGIPPSNNNTQLTFGATGNATMTNDTPGTLILNRLTFNAGAPAYTLNGNGLSFSTNTTGIGPQIVSNTANSVTINTALALTNNLTVGGTGNVTLAGPLDATGGLVKTGTGTLTLTNTASTFGGGVTISGGTVAVADFRALGNGGLTFDGGAFAYTGPSTTTAKPMSITPNGGTISVGPATSLMLNVALAGTGGLTKTGPGTLVLSGTNTYGGPTIVTAGALTVATGGVLATGAVTIGAAGILTGTGTINGPTEIAGTIVPGAGNAGALNFGAAMAWDAGGKYVFAYAAITGLNPGVNYTTILSASKLNLSTITAANPFTIAITQGTVQTNGVPVTYTLGTFNSGGPNGGVTGFNPASFAFTGSYAGTPAVSLDATQNQLLLTFIPALVTSLTWTGSASGNWNNSANWSAGVPVSNFNTRLTFGATANPTMTNDISGTLILNRLTVNAGSPTYTLGGNGLDLRTDNTGALAQIVNNSTSPLVLNADLTLTNNLTIGGAGNVTLSGTISGAGSLTHSGTGTLTLGAGSTAFAGGIIVQDGTVAVAADAYLGIGPVTVATAVAALSYTSSTTTARFLTLTGGVLSVGAGATLTLSGATVTSGYLGGTGTFATDPAIGARLANVTSLASTTVNSNSGADLLLNFTNGGPLNVAANIPVGTPVTFNGFTNQISGSLLVGAASRVNVANFQSAGVVTISPAVVGSGQFTLLTNAGESPLFLGGGSRTFVGTAATAGTSQNPNFVAGIDLHGNNAIISGGLLVNNGFIADSVGGGSVIVDFGGLYKGAGTTFVPIVTQNGGKVQAGNSPGVAQFGVLTIGPGAINNFGWQINDAGPSATYPNAPGVGGPSPPYPPAAQVVSGWSELQANMLPFEPTHTLTSGNLTWTATSAPGSQFIFSLETLLGPTTPVGSSPDGPMSNFDPNLRYAWPFITYQGVYSGPTDSATLTADTLFDTSQFANTIPSTAKFTIAYDAANKAIELVYTPVPEPGTLVLTAAGLGLAGWVRRRRIG